MVGFNEYQLKIELWQHKDVKCLPVVEDTRGNLAFIQRVFAIWIQACVLSFDVPSNAYRGGAFTLQQETLIALSGSFEVVLNDGTEKSFLLNKPNVGLYQPEFGENCKIFLLEPFVWF
jgi:hypothetical protein